MQFDQLGRREFITLISGAAAAWPLAARAQQPAMPVIGFLDGQSFDLHLMTAFREGLKEAGYIERRTVSIYFRSADGQTDRLVTLAGDIVGRRVAVIVTTGGGAAALAAFAATTTIPIVFVTGVDPVTSGLVISLNRPGRNATGVYIFQQVLEGKRLGLLRELVPTAALIAVLLNPTNANFQAQLTGVQDAARALGQQVSILSANTERDIDAAFATVIRSGAGALLVGSDPFFNSERDQVISLAARHAIPAIYEGCWFRHLHLHAGASIRRTALRRRRLNQRVFLQQVVGWLVKVSESCYFIGRLLRQKEHGSRQREFFTQA